MSTFMRKQYESPRAEKFEFNYLENVFASDDDDDGAVELGKPIQACTTHNGNPNKVQTKNKNKC